MRSSICAARRPPAVCLTSVAAGGLRLVTAARATCAGEAVGIDIRHHRDRYAASRLATVENAPGCCLGLGCSARTPVVFSLSPDTPDVVVSSLTLLPDAQARRIAVKEMHEYSRPGWRLATFNTRSYRRTRRNPPAEQGAIHCHIDDVCSVRPSRAHHLGQESMLCSAALTDRLGCANYLKYRFG